MSKENLRLMAAELTDRMIWKCSECTKEHAAEDLCICGVCLKCNHKKAEGEK